MGDNWILVPGQLSEDSLAGVLNGEPYRPQIIDMSQNYGIRRDQYRPERADRSQNYGILSDQYRPERADVSQNYGTLRDHRPERVDMSQNYGIPRHEYRAEHVDMSQNYGILRGTLTSIVPIRGPQGPSGSSAMPNYPPNSSSAVGVPRFNSSDQMSTITHSGLSAASSIQTPGHGGTTISMQYVAQAGQMGQNKGPQQPHFIAVTTNRARMPLQKDDVKVEQEEQPMDTSGGPVSNIVMASDGGGDAASSAGSQSEQRLKVEDALNYLDQVKYKFGNQPQVYNDFLDIMKEFKSQSIDTPGVIARVSQLFRGHPELIVGFNTFLPPGYKIEIQANESVSLSMIGQGGGYVVTTVQPGLPGPGGHPTSQTTMIHQHPSAPPTPARPALSNITPSSGRISPIPIALPGNASTSSSSSAFTHSFTSPFVQSAFPSLQTQPVEFNHAINYVNKIKNRFQGHPDKYKQFLEILHTYQKEQRNIKDGHPPSSKHLTEHEVYAQVAKLFENQEDLLKEFGQFLPDATNHQNTSAIDQAKKSVKMNREFVSVQPSSLPGIAQKRPAVQPSGLDRKKPKELSSVHYGKQVTLTEAARYGTLNDFAFFDKVRVAMKSPHIYNNFLRCINLFSDQLFSANELLTLVNPFLGKIPELHNWFKDFVGVKHDSASGYYDIGHPAAVKAEKLTEEQMVEIDYTTCKRLGVSYCAMPSNNIPPKCSGRSLLPLCSEVLNDVYISFPAWSEDTAFSSSRKTAFEECMYRVEDERFELDVVIETNAAVIRTLEYVAKKMTRMGTEELADFELDESLGGTSNTIHQRAIRRIYGDKAPEIIEGLKKQPTTAIPLVLRRLKAKEEEWREAQKHFNKAWKEQTEKFYLKSLDLQGITFKQTDVRALRSKALVNEIETLFDERQERMIANPVPNSPHLTLLYKDKNLLDDACLLLLHHVRRQTSIHKDDKRKIKQLLKHFVADLFHHNRMELSDDEDEASHDEHDGRRSPHENTGHGRKRNGNGKRGNGGKVAKKDVDAEPSNSASAKEVSEPQAGDSSTASVWSELTKQKKLSTAQESQESRRTIAKRELKLLLSDAKAHELTDVGRTSLRDKANRAYLSEMSKDDSAGCPTSEQPSASKRRATRRSFSQRQGSGDGTIPPRPRVEPTGNQRNAPAPSPDEDEAYSLFFANSKLYVFLRLHHILCERLAKIHERAIFHLKEQEAMEKNSVAEELRMIPPPPCEVSNYYQHFLELIRSLLDGNIEPSAYEDTLREMFGIHAYVAYTMDKVVGNAVRQLQGIMTDEASQKCLEMFHQAGKRNGNGGFHLTMANRAIPELVYQKQVEKLCGDETCVKIMIFKKNCRMTMELLECDTPSDIDQDQKAKYSNYVSKFLKPDSSIPESIMSALGANPVFLARNIRKLRKKNLLEWTSDNAKRNQGSGQPNVIKDEKMEVDLTEGEIPNATSTVQTSENSELEIKVVSSQEAALSQGSEDVILDKEQKIGQTEESGVCDKVPEDSGDQLVMKSVEKSQNERTAEFLMQENLQCQFNLSSYRMVYLTNSEDCIYLKGAMQRARKTHKKLSMKLSNRFRIWHQKWITANVLEAMTTSCGEFLLDKNNVSPKKTSRKSISRTDKPPYRKYHKYVVE